MSQLHLHSGRPWPGPHDFDSAAPGLCLSVRLRSRIGFPPPPRGAARPLPGRASATHLAVQPRPAPLRVACLSFGFVDADLPDSRCRRCRQSVESANTSLLTARRLRPAGLRPASRRLSRRSSAPERTITFFPAPKEREERRSFRCRSPAQPSTAGRPSARPFPSSAAEPCRLGPRDSPPFFVTSLRPLDKTCCLRFFLASDA